MSLFQDRIFRCPDCNSNVPFLVADSVNADRRPDLRDAILDGSYQRGVCPLCDCAFRVAPELTYLDVGRGQWIVALPVEAMADWAEAEARTRMLFDRTFGAAAPAAGRTIGRSISPRLTFGWAGLREKLIARERGVDDAALEALKAALLRAGAAERLSDDLELRLLSADDANLDLAWVLADGFAEGAFRVPRRLCAEIVEDPAWKSALDALRASPFVDINRILVPETPESAPA